MVILIKYMGSTFEPLKLKLRAKFHNLLAILHEEFGGDFRGDDKNGIHLDSDNSGGGAYPAIGMKVDWNLYLRKNFVSSKKIAYVTIRTRGHSDIINVYVKINDIYYEKILRDFFAGFDEELKKYFGELGWKYDRVNLMIDVKN